MMSRFTLLVIVLSFIACQQPLSCYDLSQFKKNQRIAGFEVQNLYSDSNGGIVGARFLHIATGAPVFILKVETVPQVITWIDTPVESNEGLPHSLEHLLLKGKKGRYLQLLQEMHLDQSGACTSQDFVCYGFSSGSGMDGFFDSFHSFLDALFCPDFTDSEAEREFYHFGVADGPGAKKLLIEQGTVYDEQRAVQERYTYYFELNRRVLGDHSPFRFDSTGAADEMRAVTPAEIRQFHDRFYKIGPSTGFIFAFPPKENLISFLAKISEELRQFSTPGKPPIDLSLEGPKYPIHPSENATPSVYPFPGPNSTAPGFIHFAWRPGKAHSQLELKLLELLSGGLAGGEESLLQKTIVDSKTRLIDSGATAVDFSLFLENSPVFPVVIIEVAGIPGDRISPDKITALRNVIQNKIKDISKYPDQSEELKYFNGLIGSYAKSLRRSERVWTKNAPEFGSYLPKMDWKMQFERLAMSNTFIQSVSEEQVWEGVDEQLRSGKNIWRDLIANFHLTETPYATANAPSPRLLNEIAKAKDERIQNEAKALMSKYGASDEQKALSRFAQEEARKTQEINKIADSIPSPHFTEHPPLSPDDNLQYRQFSIENIPVTAVFFEAPPTIDIGLSFNLRQVPRTYYKYLPLFVNCLDSLGLHKEGRTTTYSELKGQIQSDIYGFSTGYEFNPVSKRADFVVRASAASKEEFRLALGLIQQIMEFNDLDLANVDRLRDLVANNISSDDWYVRQDVSTLNTGYAFRYQDDPLFFALHSRFTRAHWNARLKWLLHQPVSADAINALGVFAQEFLPTLRGMPKEEMSQRLDAIKATGLEGELVEYWKKNFSSFPEAELADGLGQLAVEAQQDLKIGPERTIEDLRNLQRIILDRQALYLNLTISRSDLAQIQPDLIGFLKSLPSASAPVQKTNSVDPGGHVSPIMLKLRDRYRWPDAQPPFYVGFVNPNRLDGSVVFYTDFPGYSQLDHESLVRVLASKIFSGKGPQGFYMKTLESGLAYSNGIASDARWKVIWYSATRVPNIAALIKLVDSIAATVSKFQDRNLVDYALSQTFSFSRAMATFSDRGKAMAQDVRDGNDPETVRRFSEAILQLRKDPALTDELNKAGLSSICGVLLMDDCQGEQQVEHSLFFFMGSERALTETEQAVPLARLLRVWPSDYWLP